MDDLKLYEEGFVNILPDHRDHYIHSASVYVLGLAIYNSCKPIRKALKTERHEDYDTHQQKTSFLFRWSLSACLHDIAYPLELSLTSFKKYSKYLHALGRDDEYIFLTIKKDIYERFDLLPILEPDNNVMPVEKKDTALGLIANYLTSHRLRNAPITYETLLHIMKKYLHDNLQKGRIDHGVFSSLIVLKRVHELYTEKRWDLWDYYYEVVEAATAIFLHNSYRYSQMKDIYGQGVYKFDYPSPLGYLLYLSDTVCEWLRGPKVDFNFYGFYACDDKIYLKVPRSVKTKMKDSSDLFDSRIPVKITDRWPSQ
jgi:hypothetical protein